MLALAAGPAAAGGKKGSGGSSGALGKVTSGTRAQTSSSSRGSSGGSSGSSEVRDHRSSDHYHDGYYPAYYGGCIGGCGGVAVYEEPGRQRRLVKPDFAIDLGVQSVHDSDAAALIDARIAHGRLGAGVTVNSYWERNRLEGMDPETIRMNVWSILLQGSIFKDDRTDLRIVGGLAGAGSNQFDSILGPTIGVELERDVFGRLVIDGGARYYAMEHDVSIKEYRGGLRYWLFRVGYRSLDFSTGPALHGPEAGLSLRF